MGPDRLELMGRILVISLTIMGTLVGTVFGHGKALYDAEMIKKYRDKEKNK